MSAKSKKASGKAPKKTVKMIVKEWWEPVDDEYDLLARRDVEKAIKAAKEVDVPKTIAESNDMNWLDYYVVLFSPSTDWVLLRKWVLVHRKT